MSELRKLENMGLSPDAIKRVSLLLGNIVKGNDVVLVSPIAKQKSPEDILSGWDSIFNSNLSKMNDILLELESSNRSKFGPRSLAAPWNDRKESLYSSYEYEEPFIRKIEYKVNPLKRLRPLSEENAKKYIKKSTNAGLPTMLKKGTVLSSDEVLDQPFYWPAVLFTRTQENYKTRNVWGFSLDDILYEMRFYRPILEYQRNLDWRAALRKANDIDLAITKLIQYAKERDYDLLSIDFSNYDNSVKESGHTWVFMSYFASLFQDSFTKDFLLLRKNFSNVGIVTPDGILKGPHGIPSGSAFTNEVGSVWQHFVAQDYNIFIGREIIQHDQQQGDDGAYAVEDAEDFKQFFSIHGVKINDEKSFVDKNFIVYLQNLYHLDYVTKDDQNQDIIRGIYPTYRALLRIVYLERFTDISVVDELKGSDYFALRTLQILETCKHHPLFEELCLYVKELDKFSLDVSDQGISAFVKLREIQEGKDVKFTEYKRGDSTNIKDFASYKLIKRFNV
jgi:hypothetical protein